MWIFGRRQHVNAELISEFLDGRLSSAQEQRVTRHADACAVCQQEIDSLRATVSAVQALPEMALPRSFTMAAPPPMIAAVRPSMPFRAPTWVYAGAASVAGLALAIVVSADTVGLLAPASLETPRSFQQSIQSTEDAAAPEAAMSAPALSAEPEMAAASEAQAGQAPPAPEALDQESAAERAMVPETQDAEPGIMAMESAAADEPPAEGAPPDAQAAPAFTKSTDEAGPAGAEARDQQEPSAAQALPPSEDPANQADRAMPEIAGLEVSPEDTVPSSPEVQMAEPDQAVGTLQEAKPGQAVMPVRFEDEGTPLVWRVSEVVLASLAVLFIIGLIWKLRVSRKANRG